MKPIQIADEHLGYLACPKCCGQLTLTSAELACLVCATRFPVERGIPRFVAAENYASTFGLQWAVHAKSQYDSYTGLPFSETRFFDVTRWSRDLSGERVLEVGSGSGRFTEQVASTGAFVMSFDYSQAVESNFESNGHRDNVLIVQGDVYEMPFRRSSFDKVFCFGMLQHTPDPRAAFLALPAMLKPGGELVIDVYKKTFCSTFLDTKYYVRPVTRRLKADYLYRLTKRWVNLMWPICKVIRAIPRVGPSINWRLLVADYSRWGVRADLLREWAYLDTFDMLSPRYDSPQTLATVRAWFEEACLSNVEVRYGFNGIVGRGVKPLCVG